MTATLSCSENQPTLVAEPRYEAADLLIHYLEQLRVEYIFGVPGGAIEPLYNALARSERRGGVRSIVARHEAGAAYMAEGYWRETGRLGVCCTTTGPGATNAVTGLTDALMDSIPIVCITGQVPTHLIGNDAFQECDTVGITRPCTKHNYLVKRIEDLPRVLHEAFHIASSGRPGPVVVDMPKDIQFARGIYSVPTEFPHTGYQPKIKGDNEAIKQAIELMAHAKRPLFYTGGGVINSGKEASKLLTELVKQTGFPITSTLMGLGAFPAADPQWMGMLGMHGTLEANMAMQDCDVLLAVGARFDDRVIGNPAHFFQNPRTIIHIDVDPSSISKRVKVDVPIVGDVKSVLADLLELLDEAEKSPNENALASWWQKIGEWRGKNCLNYDRSSAIIKPQFVIEKLYEVTKGDAYVTSDVGQHQMWAAQYYKFDKPRRWLNSGGLGTMGVGLPYAMGAQLAHPEAQVACITGEGSIQMNIQELSTCKQFHLPIKIILLNNRYLGMVRQWQQFFYENRYSESYMDSLPDFVKLAESYGHVGMLIEQPGDVEGALQEAFGPGLKDQLVFLNFITDQKENVFPMVPGGKGLSEIILAEEL